MKKVFFALSLAKTIGHLESALSVAPFLAPLGDTIIDDEEAGNQIRA